MPNNNIFQTKDSLAADKQQPFSGEARGTEYGNADLAPTSSQARTWGLKDLAALWISLSACIPTYMLASALIDGGMNWWQAILTVLLGNVIVLLPMVLSGQGGTKYGIPF